MKNIWKKLAKKKKPFFILAPMAGVTDSIFRRMILKLGKPDLFFTEFVSTEHIVRVDKTPNILKYSKKERPLIVQFFGSRQEQFEICARLALKLGFDGIDINMGCPDVKVQKQGAGSELIRNPQLAREIICAVKKGCGGKIPISIKTRLGYRQKDIENWIFDILSEDVSAITIHGRMAKQGYLGAADWDEIGKIAQKIRKRFPDITIVGNGDVKNIEHGKELAERHGVDGIMIGREVMHNPWIFSNKNPTLKEKLKTALMHTKMFSKVHEDDHSFSAIKKYYKAYISGFSGATKFRYELMQSKNAREAIKIIKRLIKNS